MLRRNEPSSKRFSPELLRLLRNQIKMAPLITDVLRLPSKISDDHLRFLCPLCGDFHSAVNPKTNLGRCFSCRKNFNPIDMVMVVRKLTFREAVLFLETILCGKNHGLEESSNSSEEPAGGVRLIQKETARGKLYCVISRE